MSPAAPGMLGVGAPPKDMCCIPQGCVLHLPRMRAVSPKEGSCPPKPPGTHAGLGWDAARGWGRSAGCSGCLLGTPGHSFWGATALDAGGQWPQWGQLETGPWWEVSLGGKQSQSSLIKPRVCRVAAAHPPFAVQLPLSAWILGADRMGHRYRPQKELLPTLEETQLLPWKAQHNSNSFLKREVRGI